VGSCKEKISCLSAPSGRLSRNSKNTGQEEVFVAGMQAAQGVEGGGGRTDPKRSERIDLRTVPPAQMGRGRGRHLLGREFRADRGSLVGHWKRRQWGRRSDRDNNRAGEKRREKSAYQDQGEGR